MSVCVRERFICICQLLQTLLLDELAVEPAAPDAVLNNEPAVVTTEKCCANVDTSEVPLPLAPVPAADPDPLAVVLAVFLALDITAVAVVDGCTFVVVDDSDKVEDVEDCEPKGDEDAINAAAAEFAPPP